MKVKVIRPILHDGKHKKVGDVFDAPEPLAKELVFSGKCSFVGPEPGEPEEKKSKK